MTALYSFLGKVVSQVVNPIILLLSAAAFILFLWGILTFISNAGNEDKRLEGRTAILWGFVGLVIIFGAYGIINLGLSTFNLTPNGSSTLQGVLSPVHQNQ